ncbi:MAG: hypothetical protein ACKO96_04235, partial [Flammeovirgaceae bacterium]
NPKTPKKRKLIFLIILRIIKMLSRIMQRNVLRGAVQVSKAIKTDGSYVCFCGCRDGQHKQFKLLSTPLRNF